MATMRWTPRLSVWQATMLALIALQIVCSFCTAILGEKLGAKPKKQEYFQKPGAPVSEIIRARGYLSEDHTIVTEDGYVLTMTRCMNPLIDRKRGRCLGRRPFLFVHGTLIDASTFAMNSFDVEEAKDFSDVDVDSMSEKELIEKFNDEPSAKSLVFFALNFGHEVWLLNRRGSPLSQKRLSSPPGNHKPATPIEKYLASVEAAAARRREPKDKHVHAKRSYEPYEADQQVDPVASESVSADDADAGDDSSVSSSGRSFDLLGLGNLLTEKPEKDDTKVKEAIKSAPAALFDYGHFTKDLKISLDQRLWNYSFDEQAAYDLPKALDYVIEQTGHKRAVIVGESAGGQLIIQSLILEPERFGNKRK